ncbi:MAG: hypothetical protein GY928_17910 [Colwellia sp.]|nr:hypothetical protein [Colwellia sp.]
MNKNELIEKFDIQKKYGSKIIRIALLPIFGYAGFGIFAIKKLSFAQKNRICFSSCYLFIIFIVVGIIFCLLFRNMRRIGLVCSKCQKILDKETALSTLKCGKCGELIITENSTAQ